MRSLERRSDSFHVVLFHKRLVRLCIHTLPLLEHLFESPWDDANQDHALLFRAALVATRPIEPFIEAVYAFDTASSTEWGYPRSFVADTWIDISATLERKLAAMACYQSEVRPYPHPRSLEALCNRAKAWGNQCCLDAAEVFMTVRRIVRNDQAPA